MNNDDALLKLSDESNEHRISFMRNIALTFLHPINIVLDIGKFRLRGRNPTRQT